MKDVGGFLAQALGAILAVLAMLVFVVAVIGGGLFHRSVCVDKRTGAIEISDWSFNPLTLFQSVPLERDKICENETYTAYFVGQIPAIGEAIEPIIGGPSAGSPYYDLN